ncbi:epsin-2-like [Clytia hemisphaerica]|uniref:ENTH domain-containing protein n=1 Tax=Clytia hemisphaerica TaxID=252671 RepID=A0A7M5XMT5_9CNID|eukprot:TCONS_00044711-protein
MALRRQVKNVVKNFSDIEVKVREATSNDPWGPSSSITSEIADATYNVQAFTEIMTLLWKRINDHGKNWRHVYKSLVVLEYIVKTGSERVAQQCKENIFAIKTLKDFQFIDKDGKDQGVNVREKSKALVGLLKDEERLKAERQRALKAKERFSQSQGGIGNTNYPKNRKYQASTKYPEAKGSLDDSNISSRPATLNAERDADSRSTDGRIDSDIEKVRPSNEVEEEMQLQIALAMSREEAEKDKKTQDIEAKLFSNLGGAHQPQAPQQSSTLLNLTDSSSSTNQPSDPWGIAPPPSTNTDPWGSAPTNPPQPTVPSANVSSDPWGSAAPVSQPAADPWGSQPPAPAPEPAIDPWGSAPVSQPEVDPFAPQSSTLPAMSSYPSQSLSAIQASTLPPMSTYSTTPLQPVGGTDVDPFGSLVTTTSAPEANSNLFLSNGSHLVDVDNIMATPNAAPPAANPFMTSATNTNPFQQDKPKPKSINELRSDKNSTFVQPGSGNSSVLLPQPMQPSQNNPFL